MPKRQPEPMQPVVLDKEGVARFQENAIVRYLLDFATSRGASLNELAMLPFSDEDRRQLAQLIGYSVGGYSELGYVDNASCRRAMRKADAL